MPLPSEVARSYAGGAVAAQLVNPIGSTDTSFAITPVTGWTETTGPNAGQPLGTSGPFVIGVDVYSTSEEKILCSAVNLTTGIVTVYVAGDGTSGRGYDGTTPAAHVPGSTTFGVQPVWSSVEAWEANQAVVNATTNTVGVPVGTVVDFAGLVPNIPTNFKLADGSSLANASYATLFAALTITTAGTTTASNATITGVSASITPYVTAGMGVTLGSMAGGAVYTVQSTTSTTIVLTSGTGITGGSGNIVILPYGAADTSHFNLPDARGRTTAGQGQVGSNAQPNLYVGGTAGAGGVQSVTIGTTNLPAHNHAITDPGHVHAEGSNVFINFVSSTIGPVAAGGSSGTAGQYSPQNTLSATTGITTQNTGSGTALNVESPYLVTTKIIRVV